MHAITNYDDALKKFQQVEFDEDSYTAATDKKTDETRWLEKKLELMQQVIIDISLRNTNLWCTICNTKGHTKDTCIHNENKLKTYE